MDYEVTDLVLSLRAQGIEVFVDKRGRLALWPKEARKQLTPTQRSVLRTRPADVLAAFRDAPATVAPAVAVTPPREPAAPRPCPGCRRAPCIGPGHWAFALLHPNDPAMVAEQMT